MKKSDFYITTVYGLKKKFGYVGKFEGICFGISKDDSCKWYITELSSGFRVSEYYNSKNEAINIINSAFIEKIKDKMSKHETIGKYQEDIHNKYLQDDDEKLANSYEILYGE